MKKFLFIFSIAAILISSLSFESCSDASASKPDNPEASKMVYNEPGSYINTLKEAGFDNLPLLASVEAEEKRAYYMKLCGLNYISEGEVQEILTKNDLMIAESKYYIGDIPKEAISAFNENYKKYKENINPEPGYMLGNKFYSQEWMDSEEGKRWEIRSEILQRGVKVGTAYVIGSSDKFDNQAIEAEKKGKDPIIIVPVEGGYLELARWE